MPDLMPMELFTPHLGSTFNVVTTSEPIPLVLSTVTSLGAAPAPRGDFVFRAPFSLVFLGPAAVLLPQRTYRLSHGSLGELDIFLVPLGPKDGKLRYEAVFS